ncbi:preprotein translocase subunit SecA [Spiroplasma platyhelix]|uniref:Protein translocase subunit SecA n=1 Tax=Spiroplasma platyhelix PALS-1 TaxID=1276218 RepID=A0A846TQK5_9MOLU|nr:preprotein translocase subunit SecA [Spiroplasma platyhelix]MBE4704237.1 Protein translocase subunit SecA [Spiroplasma platyhelix PALS-1]NKE38610.1 preprotein translocase subunit SecA [Spiroplasma platyhelix PALS-1]UJB28821.1 preprotein translocase subunit SecA [Spiroplasma platyhelix PALS-1]
MWDRKILRKIRKQVKAILALEKTMQELTDEQLAAKTEEFRQRLTNGETLDDILVEAFAVAREASRRVIGLHPYPVQLIGGIVLHNGDVAEMRTGEGKTLTAVMPIYLNALSGKGVHIITVNEYLAQRDAELNKPIFDFLGISIGVNLRDYTPQFKREAYAKDVTYTTNAELGFDYLRDNMVRSFKDKVQRGLNFSIVDEADSVMIDEARTPLIISGGSKNRTPLYQASDAFSKSLVPEDYKIDWESKQIALTVTGVRKAQAYFNLKNLFDIENSELFHHIQNALRANYVFKLDVEYVVKDGEIVLVDQFTGRLMAGRVYSDGLHQAIQAKEKVNIQQETTTVATITYQNFFRLYNKLSGMTGTAKTEEEEFVKIYNMRVICIPTNKSIIREDMPDYVFATLNAKFKALINEVKERNDKGQPILIGTANVDVSERISNMLRLEGIRHEILNAKNHAREAEIISKAGEFHAVTLATNMAGRGTDIKLAPGVNEIGGLAVLGTERNEARRIDNQLRGRAGRQGDPGFSRFYVSIEDDLIMRFGGEKLKKIFASLGDDFIKSKMLTRSITRAQQKIEGLNFDARKNLLDYDNVIAQHREAMYAQRDKILTSESVLDILKTMHRTVARDLLKIFSKVQGREQYIDYQALVTGTQNKLLKQGTLEPEVLKKMLPEEVIDLISEKAFEFYLEKRARLNEVIINQIEYATLLQVFDRFWTEHIDGLSKLRAGIHLRGYAQLNPLQAYIEEASKLFSLMTINIAHQVLIMLHSIDPDQIQVRSEEKILDTVLASNPETKTKIG